MRKETQEWIHNTSMELIRDVLKSPITDEETKVWIEKAQNLLSYVDQHYKADEVKGDDGFFVVARLHRNDFEMRGFDASKVDDVHMERIAQKMGDAYVENGGFWDQIEFWGDDYKLPVIEEHE